MRTSHKGRLFRSLGVTLLVFAVLGSPLSQSVGATARAATAEPVSTARPSAVHGANLLADQIAPDTAPVVSSPLYQADNSWHGGTDVPGEFTFGAAGVADVDHYFYGFQDPPSTRVDANTAGGEAAVTLTPPTDGAVTLYVQSADAAGNRSPMATHHFYVRSGDGPASHWRLDGDTTDEVQLGGRDGTTHAGVSWQPGALGKAVKLGGSADHLTAPNALPTNTSFAISAWLKPAAIDDTVHTAVSQDGEVVSGFRLQVTADGNWRFRMAGSDVAGGGSEQASAVSDSTVATRQWTHVVGVHDETANELKLYVNGSLVSTRPYNGDVDTDGELAIGRAENDGVESQYWEGAIDEVRVYDRVLTDAEIRSRVESDDVRTGHWKFEAESSTTSVPNTVPGGQPATVHGGADYTDGAVGTALRLDGTDDHVVAAQQVARTDLSYSVSSWVRLDERTTEPVALASQNGSNEAVFQLGYSGTDRDSWDWTLRGSDGGAGATVTVSSERAPRVGVWTHLAGVYDARADEARLFVNGRRVGATEFGAAWHPGQNRFEIGRAKHAGTWGAYLPGAVDEVRGYGRVLHDNEVRDIVVANDVPSGFWPLDGEVTDHSARGLDGTTHGDPEWESGRSVAPEPDDQAIRLDGVAEYVSVPNAVDTTRSFSVSAWAKPERIGERRVVLSQDGNGTSGFRLELTSDGKWSFTMAGGGDSKRVTGDETAPQGVWTHLIGVHDVHSGEIRLYVNGSSAGATSYAAASGTVGETAIGRGQFGEQQEGFWQGAIDDVTLYSRELFEGEPERIAALEPDLAHKLRLNESDGETASDSIGGVTGTLHGDADFAPGRIGNSVSLDGDGDYVSTSTVDLRTDESFTISAWVYLSSQEEGKATAVSLDGANTSKFRLGYFRDINRPLGAWFFEMPESDTESARVTSAAESVRSPELDTWTHLTGVYDAEAGKLWLYVDGNRINDGTVSNTWQATGGLQLGRAKRSGVYEQSWQGKVDDVRLYSAKLPGDRIGSLYDSYGTN
ncbi:Concanavalin A-like lectin/glucanases superfamily protein [Actinopolyspora alba]|uniref:Concanavalin A-like lectin/glucanases superfamily protein n=1 Tax=Actinopolyspora alba TaxID=673379 RepID=A0A1I2CC95_9ACTN|nr:LamG domain-containing protein [Actinopolyspora alba]SFE65977.1 Concanavalin A-like lectin/glucanases superfamily protein [Actinopolyspora alba]